MAPPKPYKDVPNLTAGVPPELQSALPAAHDPFDATMAIHTHSIRGSLCGAYPVIHYIL